MHEITKVKTENREEWKELRSHYIGGSDAAAVIGLNPWVSPYTLWAEKSGKLPGFEGNLATEVGTYLEEFVAKKFEKETGKKVRRVNQSFLNSAYPWAIANIDREIVGEDAGLEIKTTSELNMRKFKGGEYPANYYCQCVHYLAVTGKQRWYLAVLIGNKEFKWFTIERDESEIEALMAAERDFWNRVETGTPPEIDGLQSTTDAIKAIYADSEESDVDLSGYAPILDQYIVACNQVKEVEKIRDEYANKVKDFMGSSAYGQCDRYKVSWKSQQRCTFDSRRFLEDHPEFESSEYFKKSNARVFRVNKI